MNRLNSILNDNEMSALAKQARFKPRTFVQLLLFILVFLVSGLLSTLTTKIVYPNVATTDYQESAIRLSALYFTVFTTGCCILFCTRIEKRSMASMGFHMKGAIKKYLAGFVIGLVMLGITVLMMIAFGAVNICVNPSVRKNLPMIVLYLPGYMLQGMSEEAICRGYLQMTLDIHKKQRFAVAVSSLIFAALHLLNPGITILAFVNVFLFGIMLSLLFLRTSSIWFISALHAAWNFAQGNLCGISVSGNTPIESILTVTALDTEKLSFINGGLFGAEGGICTTIVLIAVIAIILLSVKESNIATGDDTKISDTV